MEPCYAPVPVREHELIKVLDARGLRITEAWHRGHSTIARHAHRQATLTLLVDGSFVESYAYRRDMECVAPAIHVRPPGEPHLDKLGTIGAHNLVLELDDERFEDVSTPARANINVGSGSNGPRISSPRRSAASPTSPSTPAIRTRATCRAHSRPPTVDPCERCTGHP